jgi:hypothetical protein
LSIEIYIHCHLCIKERKVSVLLINNLLYLEISAQKRPVFNQEIFNAVTLKVFLRFYAHNVISSIQITSRKVFPNTVKYNNNSRKLKNSKNIVSILFLNVLPILFLLHYTELCLRYLIWLICHNDHRIYN